MLAWALNLGFAAGGEVVEPPVTLPSQGARGGGFGGAKVDRDAISAAVDRAIAIIEGVDEQPLAESVEAREEIADTAKRVIRVDYGPIIREQELLGLALNIVREQMRLYLQELQDEEDFLRLIH